MKKKMIVGAIILAVIIGVILAVGLFKSGKNGKVTYRTEAITKGDIEALVVTSGTLDAVNVVDVGSQVSGKIDKLSADFNSQVKAGQILAELDLSLLQAKVDQNQSNYQSAQASLDKAKVTLETAKKKYDRSLDLFNRNLISFEEKETAEANYLGAKSELISADARLAQAKSQLDSSKVDMSYAIIRSPIDGTVITRSVNIGQTVAASFQAPVLFKIASDLTKMQLTCSIDEADIGKVKEGQKVRFTVDAFPGDSFGGTVKQVRYASQVVSNVVTYATIVDSDNPDLKLRPGMTATVTIVVNEAKGALMVPNAALRYTPKLDPKELDKLLTDMRNRMGENRPAGQTGGNPQGGQRQGGGQAREITPEMVARFQQMAKNRQKQGGQVWILDAQGKLMPSIIRTGITDNTYSEIIRGDLKEGMKVVIGEETPGAKPAAAQQPGGMRGGPGGQMMIFR